MSYFIALALLATAFAATAQEGATSTPRLRCETALPYAVAALINEAALTPTFSAEARTEDRGGFLPSAIFLLDREVNRT